MTSQYTFSQGLVSIQAKLRDFPLKIRFSLVVIIGLVFYPINTNQVRKTVQELDGSD